MVSSSGRTAYPASPMREKRLLCNAIDIINHNPVNALPRRISRASREGVHCVQCPSAAILFRRIGRFRSGITADGSSGKRVQRSSVDPANRQGPSAVGCRTRLAFHRASADPFGEGGCREIAAIACRTRSRGADRPAANRFHPFQAQHLIAQAQGRVVDDQHARAVGHDLPGRLLVGGGVGSGGGQPGRQRDGGEETSGGDGQPARRCRKPCRPKDSTLFVQRHPCPRSKSQDESHCPNGEGDADASPAGQPQNADCRRNFRHASAMSGRMVALAAAV